MRPFPTLLLLLAAASCMQAPRPRLVEVDGVPEVLHETRALAAGDVDGDGDTDLVLGNVGFSAVWLNRGDGTLVQPEGKAAALVYGESNAVALADFDGDGDLDLFSASGGWFGALNELLRNDGSGRFQASAYDVPQDYGWTNGMGVGDVDRDGDLDLLLGRMNRSILLRNDGKGSFQTAPELLPELRAPTMAVALADFDGDGDLDAVLGNAIYERNRLWLNDGTGRFLDETEDRLPPDQDDTYALAVGDVDGDGDLDVVTGNGRLGGEQPRLYGNDGRARFTDLTASRLPVARCQTLAVALLDVDGDSDLDLVLGNADGAAGAQSLLWLNDGRGRFQQAPPGTLPDRRERTTCLLPVDLDGDGRPELVVGNGCEGGSRTRILRLAAPAGGPGTRRR